MPHIIYIHPFQKNALYIVQSLSNCKEETLQFNKISTWISVGPSKNIKTKTQEHFKRSSRASPQFRCKPTLKANKTFLMIVVSIHFPKGNPINIPLMSH